jgi:hypothetical protein
MSALTAMAPTAPATVRTALLAAALPPSDASSCATGLLAARGSSRAQPMTAWSASMSASGSITARSMAPGSFAAPRGRGAPGRRAARDERRAGQRQAGGIAWSAVLEKPVCREASAQNETVA